MKKELSIKDVPKLPYRDARIHAAGKQKPIHPTATYPTPHTDVEDVTTWYDEKDRISSVHIQVPKDETTARVLSDADIDVRIMRWCLAALIVTIGAILM